MTTDDEVYFSRLTATAAVGDPGLPIALFGWTMATGTPGTGVVAFQDSADGIFSTTIFQDVPKKDNVSYSYLVRTLPTGIVFPDGLWAFISGLSAVTVFYRQLRT